MVHKFWALCSHYACHGSAILIDRYRSSRRVTQRLQRVGHVTLSRKVRADRYSAVALRQRLLFRRVFLCYSTAWPTVATAYNLSIFIAYLMTGNP